jgi:lipid II:glycine glycyltransferase (peptidoglycan interpeptide bridge formation enzyme)
MLEQTGERAGFGIHSATYYRLAWQLFQPRSHLLLAEQDGTPLAAHMVMADRRCGYYLYSAATPEGLKAGANHLLQWHGMQWARAAGCTTYDLWGIPDALGQAAACDDAQCRDELQAAAQDDPLIGVYRFKKGFGGRIVRYLPAYDRVYLPPLYRMWQRRVG